MADQTEQLSAATKQDIANALQVGAQLMNTLESQEFQELSNSMQAAASALKEGNNLQAQEDLYQFASGLRDMHKEMAGGSKDGSASTEGGNDIDSGMAIMDREKSSSNPIKRIYGEKGTFNLGAQESEGPIVDEALGSDEGDHTLAGETNRLDAVDSSVGAGMLLPYKYPWEWRDVVAEYFSRR